MVEQVKTVTALICSGRGWNYGRAMPRWTMKTRLMGMEGRKSEKVEGVELKNAK